MEVLCQTTRDLTWAHGLVVASTSWFVATVLGALPHWLSGHFGSFLDACFEKKLIVLPCGVQTVRFRPSLNITDADIDAGIGIIRSVLTDMNR